jgi:hypothetical protein
MLALLEGVDTIAVMRSDGLVPSLSLDIMRRIILTGIAGLILVACSNPTPPEAVSTSGPPDYQALEAILGACGTSQSTVATALESSDTEVALRTLEVAQQACAAAATRLRQTPIPSVNSALAADAIDSMASGLGQIAGGIRLMERSPARARTRAQAGMQTYKDGIAKLHQAGI